MNFNALNYILLFDDLRFQSIFLLLSVWSLIWKGIALWKSAHNNHRNWFIALLIINTFGILDIIYLFYFNNNKKNRENAPEKLTND